MSAVTLMRSLIWKRKSLAGALGKAAAGQRELQTAPAGLPVFRFIIEDPGCGHGLLRLYRPFLRKEPALFPGSLRAAGSGCCPVLPDSQSVPL